MTVLDAPLVPAARLGALLVARRRALGLSLEDIAARSNGRFRPSWLEEVERGRMALDESLLRVLVDVYEIDSDPLIPDRSQLIVDLNNQQIGVGATAVPLQTSTSDHVLERYVALLYMLRGETPGRRLTLRDDDLDVLGFTLDRTQERLRDELFAIMAAHETATTTRLLGRRTAIGAVGLLVGVTAVGSLVIVGSTSVATSPVALDGVEPAAQVIGSGASSTAAGGRIVLAGSSSAGRDLANAAADAAVDAPANVPQAIDVDDVVPPIEIPQADTLGVDTELTVVDPAAAAVSSVADAAGVAADNEVDAPGRAARAASSKADAVVADPSSSSDTEITAESLTEIATAGDDRIEVAPATDRLSQIKAHLGFDVDALIPGWTIVLAGDHIVYEGLTNRVDRTITIFESPGHSVQRLSEILAHEVGHVVDLQRLGDDDRRAWIELRNMPSVWWAGNGLSDFAVGAGDFAEAVAAHLTGSPSHSVYGGFTAEQMQFVAEVLN